MEKISPGARQSQHNNVGTAAQKKKILSSKALIDMRREDEDHREDELVPDEDDEARFKRTKADNASATALGFSLTCLFVLISE